MDRSKPSLIIDRMMEQDAFSRWLAIERLEEDQGFCKIKMSIRNEMCNGFGIAHGGIAYSFADSALAFAANTHGRKAVSIETSVSHITPLQAGDIIIATAIQKSNGAKLGIYEVLVNKLNGELAALIKGTVYYKDEFWT